VNLKIEIENKQYDSNEMNSVTLFHVLSDMKEDEFAMGR
jgi:hypothetical protein